jgi:hypothetical protein
MNLIASALVAQLFVSVAKGKNKDFE